MWEKTSGVGLPLEYHEAIVKPLIILFIYEKDLPPHNGHFLLITIPGTADPLELLNISQ